MSEAVAKVLTLKAMLRPVIKQVYDGLSGEFTRDEAADALVVALDDVDLNDFKIDVAKSLIDTEETGRAAKLPADSGGQLSFEDVEDKFFNDQAIIKLGDGGRIKTREARLSHGLIHQGKLNEKAAEVANASMRHNTMLVLCQPYIEADPSLTLCKAWALWMKDNPQK